MCAFRSLIKGFSFVIIDLFLKNYVTSAQISVLSDDFKRTSDLMSFNISVRNYLFSQTNLLQKEPFLTMFYTIDSIPLHDNLVSFYANNYFE